MQNILVLGAGFVARPLIRYLLEKTEFRLTVADIRVQQAEKLIAGHPRGKAVKLDVNDEQALSQIISDAQIVVSLLPWIFHIKVAKVCLQKNKHLVTASYVKPEMKALDSEAKKRGLLFLNEIGVDPGIDHMAAMKIINDVKNRGGQIVSFYSYCGGLPSFQSNNNPFGYKFSWSPTGVMLAALNDGRYLKDGKIIQVPGEKLFQHYWLKDIPGVGTFEAYVNRDALPYIDLYHIQGVKTMYRGTLRNISHCESWDYFKKLGLFDREKQYDFDRLSVKQVLSRAMNSKGQNMAKEVAAFLNIPEFSVTIQKLQWLGMFTDQKLPLGRATIFDMFAYLMEHKLVYNEGETDMLVQHHEFIAQYANGNREKIEATLLDTGIPFGDTSMARTVGLPVAIATRLIAEGKIHLSGVHIPVLPEIYEPVLDELAKMDIKFVERHSWL